MNNSSPSKSSSSPHHHHYEQHTVPYGSHPFGPHHLFKDLINTIKKSAEWREFVEFTNPAILYSMFLYSILGTWALFRSIRTGLVRFKTADDLTTVQFNNKTRISGVVVRVGDGDGFRLVHMPWIRALKWKLFDRKSLPPSKKPPLPDELSYLTMIKSDPSDTTGPPLPLFNSINEDTISVRFAAVDAPECSHFGKSPQKWGPIVRQWLQHNLIGQWVTVTIQARDQYGRALCYPYLNRSPFLPNINLPIYMAKHGLAVVYEGAGAEYCGFEDKLRHLQEIAKKKKFGLWSEKDAMTPMDFKKKASPD